MTRDAGLLPLLARLLEYPGPGYLDVVVRCHGAAELGDPDSARRLESFAAAVEGKSIEALQELFTRTFDLDPKCTLDLGWHLFGENYERGDFLVRMREELSRHGVDEGQELPDHLPHVLDLLARVEPDRAAELSTRSVIPAVEKIRKGLEGQDNPFEHVLVAVCGAVSALASAPAGGPHRG